MRFHTRACGPGASNPTTTNVRVVVISHFRGLPDRNLMPHYGIGRRGAAQTCAAWAGAHLLDVSTWGNGTCPNIPISVAVTSPHAVVIKTAQHPFSPGGVCTADLSLTTSVLRLPGSVGSAKQLLLQVDHLTYRLPGRR